MSEDEGERRKTSGRHGAAEQVQSDRKVHTRKADRIKRGKIKKEMNEFDS